MRVNWLCHVLKKTQQGIPNNTHLQVRRQIYALFEPGLEILLSRAKLKTLDNYSARPDMNLWPLGLVLMLIQHFCNYEMRTGMK